jgi:hypothetical protein
LLKKIFSISFLLSFIFFTTSAYSYSISVSPNPGYAGKEFIFKFTSENALPSYYGLKIQLGDGGGGWLGYQNMTPDSNNRIFTKTATITKAGDNRKYRIGVFKNGSLLSKNVYERTYTVNEKVSTGSVKGTLYPSEISNQAQFEVITWMGSLGWNYSDRTVPGLTDDSVTINFKQITGWTAPSSKRVYVKKGETVNFSGRYIKKVVPINGQCGTAHNYDFPHTHTNYSSSYTQCSQGSPNDTSFPNPGSEVHWYCSGQNGGSQSQQCSASRQIHTSSNISVSPNQGYAGNTFEFQITLTGSLPSIYKAKIDFGDGGGGWLGYREMTAYNNRQQFKYSTVINKTGNNRKYRIGIFKNGSLYSAKYVFNSTYTVQNPPTNITVSTVSPQWMYMGTKYTLFTITGSNFTLEMTAALLKADCRNKKRVSSTQFTLECRHNKAETLRLAVVQKTGMSELYGRDIEVRQSRKPTIVLKSTTKKEKGLSESNSLKVNEGKLKLTFILNDLDSDLDSFEVDFDRERDLDAPFNIAIYPPPLREKQGISFNDNIGHYEKTYEFTYPSKYLKKCPNLEPHTKPDILNGSCWRNHIKWRARVFDKQGNSSELVASESIHIYDIDRFDEYKGEVAKLESEKEEERKKYKEKIEKAKTEVSQLEGKVQVVSGNGDQNVAFFDSSGIPIYDLGKERYRKREISKLDEEYTKYAANQLFIHVVYGVNSNYPAVVWSSYVIGARNYSTSKIIVQNFTHKETIKAKSVELSKSVLEISKDLSTFNDSPLVKKYGSSLLREYKGLLPNNVDIHEKKVFINNFLNALTVFALAHNLDALEEVNSNQQLRGMRESYYMKDAFSYDSLYSAKVESHPLYYHYFKINFDKLKKSSLALSQKAYSSSLDLRKNSPLYAAIDPIYYTTFMIGFADGVYSNIYDIVSGLYELGYISYQEYQEYIENPEEYKKELLQTLYVVGDELFFISSPVAYANMQCIKDFDFLNYNECLLDVISNKYNTYKNIGIIVKDSITESISNELDYYNNLNDYQKQGYNGKITGYVITEITLTVASGGVYQVGKTVIQSAKLSKFTKALGKNKKIKKIITTLKNNPIIVGSYYLKHFAYKSKKYKESFLKLKNQLSTKTKKYVDDILDKKTDITGLDEEVLDLVADPSSTPNEIESFIAKIKKGVIFKLRRTPKGSEDFIYKSKYPTFKPQKSFDKKSSKVPYGESDSVRPDLWDNETKTSIEVKNYYLEEKHSHLVYNIVEQAQKRQNYLPQIPTQKIEIDVLGQNISSIKKDAIKQAIFNKSGGIIKKEHIIFFK